MEVVNFMSEEKKVIEMEAQQPKKELTEKEAKKQEATQKLFHLLARRGEIAMFEKEIPAIEREIVMLKQFIEAP